MTGPWRRWSAASIITKAISIERPRRGGSPARPSSRSSTRRRSTRASHPASVVLDAPIVLDDSSDTKAWRPKNDSNKFYGPTRLREALVRSRNLVTIRLMREIGGEYARNYVTRFGFDKSQLPDDLTLALGTAEVSPLRTRRRLRRLCQRRLSHQPVFHRPNRGRDRQNVFHATPVMACFPAAGAAPAAPVAGGADVGCRPLAAAATLGPRHR